MSMLQYLKKFTYNLAYIPTKLLFHRKLLPRHDFRALHSTRTSRYEFPARRKQRKTAWGSRLDFIKITSAIKLKTYTSLKEMSRRRDKENSRIIKSRHWKGCLHHDKRKRVGEEKKERKRYS